MPLSILRLAPAAVLALAATGAAVAQTATPPNNVGVSQGTAAEAASKAVPRFDTGTLVRTAPNAPDRAAAAANDTRAAVGTTPGATTTTTTGDTLSPAPMRRAARADRN